MGTTAKYEIVTCQSAVPMRLVQCGCICTGCSEEAAEIGRLNGRRLPTSAGHAVLWRFRVAGRRPSLAAAYPCDRYVCTEDCHDPGKASYSQIFRIGYRLEERTLTNTQFIGDLLHRPVLSCPFRVEYVADIGHEPLCL